MRDLGSEGPLVTKVADNSIYIFYDTPVVIYDMRYITCNSLNSMAAEIFSFLLSDFYYGLDFQRESIKFQNLILVKICFLCNFIIDLYSLPAGIVC